MWHARGFACVYEVRKMAKDIAVGVLWYRSYLVWLLFGDSTPICSFIFLKVFLLLVSVVFWGEEKGMNGV